ncbi:MAG: hypothetical protein FVQ80_01545 [Planctomycetes bacterium]|nr:hypothetical protein [Planctomycetota bacterium]
MRTFKNLSLLFCCILSGVALSGCFVVDTVDFVWPQGKPKDSAIRYAYDQTKLKVSNSADVLSTIHLPEYELLSQSKSVVATHGAKRRKHQKMWFKMVAFDEDALTAQRKYILFEDEKPKFLYADPAWGVKFECEIVLSKEILNEPYANENARRIAVLKEILKRFQGDMGEVEADNKELRMTGMIAHQALTSLVTELGAEPGSAAQAGKLDSVKGVEFSNMTYTHGLAWMRIECDDIVRVKIFLGSFAKKYKKQALEEGSCD